ncbi:MAG: NAD(+) synthase [Candidatus Hydrogenedentes bacterium]|nr:NAD(+) synthase [Candidatus Hydrogenedentota bacterium]
MRLVRIGVAAVSVKVGDFSGNAARLKAVIADAKRQKVNLLVTPELCISGYSLEDRVWWPEITRRSWDSLLVLAKACKGITAFFGLPVRVDSLVYNAAALVHDGKVRGLILKRHLPTYSIFYEGRNYTSWAEGVTEINGVPAGDLVFDLPFGKVSAEICEDLWSTNSPAGPRARAGAEIICNPSGSPFTPLKNEHRRKLIMGASSGFQCVYAYSNILGLDNSRLVFDGGGIIATPDGSVVEGPLLSKKYWTLTTSVVDLDDVSRQRGENTTWRLDVARTNGKNGVVTIDARDGKFITASVKDYAAQLPNDFYVPGASWTMNDSTKYLDELFDALVLGLRDYFEKVGAFEKYLVALSGGRDSALCLLLAVHAATALREGKDTKTHSERVASVYLPNKPFSSKGTEDAARALAHELGVPFHVVSISEESEIALKKAAEMTGSPKKISALAKQNLQARVRGNMMLNWANSENALLLVTSNLSEAAVGYTTTGGDNQGGYSPIANVPKTLVTRLVEHIAQRDGIKSIQKVLDIPPSAELGPDQQDEKDLMPYVVLDDLLFLFARRRMSLPDCWRVLVYRHPKHKPEQLRAWTTRFGKLFVYNQWKREQLPVTMKVLDLDLDPKSGFRFPVTQSIDDELRDLAKAKLEPVRP